MTGISYIERNLPRSGAKLKVAEGLYWLRFPLPFALDHINLWLLEDGDGWTLVDSGFGSGETRALWKTMFQTALEGRPIRRIVVTHYHPDHLGQAAWLAERFGAPVCMTAGEWALASLLIEQSDAEMNEGNRALLLAHGLDAARTGQMTRRGNLYRRAISGLPASFTRLVAGQRLSINGQSWEVLVGSGHSPEHACLYRADDQVLLSGDQILPSISSNVSVRKDAPEADPLADFLASLQKLQDLPEETRVMPAHGKPFQGLHNRAAKLIAHHREQLDQVQRACLADALTAADLLPVLFRRELNPQQLHFAMGESIAHANHLAANDRLERVCEDEVYRFRAVT